MATVQANGSPVGYKTTVNDGGVIKANGSDSNRLRKDKTSSTSVGVFGSTVIDNNVSDKALSDGIFSYNRPGSRPIAKRLTTDLATVNNNFLRSAGGDPVNRRGLHKSER